MRSSLFAFAFFALSALLPAAPAPEAPTPSIPNTAQSGTLQGEVVSPGELFPIAETKPRTRADRSPGSVSIPSIGLKAPIQHMGVLKNGELDVPDGTTNRVGWYAAGTLPGERGSAVFDAHVFAAFSKLRYAEVGDHIYVTAADGEVLDFVIEDSRVFALRELSPDYLFNRADTERLTLITCAGKLTKDRSTYTHRLVVSARLVK